MKSLRVFSVFQAMMVWLTSLSLIACTTSVPSDDADRVRVATSSTTQEVLGVETIELGQRTETATLVSRDLRGVDADGVVRVWVHLDRAVDSRDATLRVRTASREVELKRVGDVVQLTDLTNAITVDLETLMSENHGLDQTWVDEIAAVLKVGVTLADDPLLRDAVGETRPTELSAIRDCPWWVTAGACLGCGVVVSCIVCGACGLSYLL